MDSRFTNITAVGLAVVTALFFLLAPASAQQDFLSLGEGSNQPIDIKSKKVTVRNVPNGQETVFEGTVSVKQANVVMNCDRLVVTRDEKKAAGSPEKPAKKPSKEAAASLSDIRSITASGNVKIGQEERTALAGKAVFDNVKRTITLSETPRLWQGGDMMEAETIIIYLDENRAELAGKNGKEIRMQINPGKQRKEKEKPSPGQGN
jgi:lipopolysaccharide transport protein LptA